MSALFALIVSLIITGLAFLLFMRKSRYRMMALSITFLVSLVMGVILAEELFLKDPFGIEMIHAG